MAVVRVENMLNIKLLTVSHLTLTKLSCSQVRIKKINGKLHFLCSNTLGIIVSRGILKLSIIYTVTVTQRCKKASTRFDSQVSLLFWNIIGSKYENGLSCHLFLAETQPRSQGLYHFRYNTVSTESAETFGLRKILSNRIIRRKNRHFTL